jgi:phosphate transport system permease protein
MKIEVGAARKLADGGGSGYQAEGPEGAVIGGRNPQLEGRHRKGRIWLGLLRLSTMVGVVALIVLLVDVANSAYGYVAVEDRIDRSTLVQAGQSIEDLDSPALLSIMRERLSTGAIGRLEREKPLSERSRGDLLAVILDEIVEPQVLASWTLSESMLNRGRIEAQLATDYPGARLEFRRWLDGRFATASQSSEATKAGVRTAILGSVWTILITIIAAFPLGVGAAIYLEEYADHRRWINRVIQTNINNLAGVPSIIYGMLGLAIFVRALGGLTSGAWFGLSSGDAGSGGRTVLSAGLTLAILVLPLVIINSQEAIRAVPSSLRQASYGLGATRWQTIRHHVLPGAISGILTGTILSISRAIGETAPLVVVGAATFIRSDPSGPFSKFTTLPIQIYQWTARPQAEFRHIAAAAILVLLGLLLTTNAAAVLLRNRYQVRS